MALVVVDTNLISLLVKLKHGQLKKDEATGQASPHVLRELLG